MTRTEHHGTDPRNRLCSCPSRVHGHLCAYRQHLHMDPFPLPAFQTLQQLCKVRNPAREEISPPSTRQLCLADLPHPELNPQHTKGIIPSKQTPAQPRCRSVHRQPHAGNLQLLSLSPPRHSQDASCSSKENILVPWTQKILPAAAFSQPRRWFEQQEGRQVAVSYLHAAPRVNWFT